DFMFLQLVSEIEVSARAVLAARLAPIGNAPPIIIRTLAFDNAIEVAAPVLGQSQGLDTPTLSEIARTKSQGHLLAISGRPSLEHSLTDILVERGNREVLQNTAKNPGAMFSETGFSRLVERSQGDDALALSVGARPDIPRHLFLKLLARASDV